MPTDPERMLEYLRQAQLELLQLAVAPRWLRGPHGETVPLDVPNIPAMQFQLEQAQRTIERTIGMTAGIDLAAPGGDATTCTIMAAKKKLEEKPPDPRLAAERLIRTVLPEELSVSLSAIGEFEYQAKQHRYKLFKGKKTHCFQDEKTFSCCIGLSDTQAPDADRIVAEWLLLKNDEPKYLATANLTQIAGPMPAPAIRPDHGIGGMYRRNVLGDWGAWPAAPYPGRIGNTIQARYPERYRESSIYRAIAQECFRMLFVRAPFDRPYPEMRLEDWQGRYEQRIHQIEMDPDFEFHPPEELRQRILRPAIEELRQRLSPERMNISGFFQVGPGGADAYEHVHIDGKHLSLARHFDVVDYRHRIALLVGVIIPR